MKKKSKIIKENMGAVKSVNPEIEKQMGGKMLTVEPKNGIINPYAQKNTYFLAKDKNGVIHAVDNQTGKILMSDIAKFIENFKSKGGEGQVTYGMAAEDYDPTDLEELG